MDSRLQEIIDHHEIRKTLADYCRGCDRGDVARMASVYHEDSWDDHGAIKATGHEFAHMMTERLYTERGLSLYHMLGQSTIDVADDAAKAETYFFAVSGMSDDRGGTLCRQMGGRFADRLVRTAEGWKIKYRMVMRDWSIVLPVEVEWDAARSLRPGAIMRDDASFVMMEDNA